MKWWIILALMFIFCPHLDAQVDPNFTPLARPSNSDSKILEVNTKDDWLALLKKGQVNSILRFVVGQSEIYSLDTKDGNQIFDSHQVFRLKGHKGAIFVARWKAGKYDWIYIIDPNLVKKKKNPVLLRKFVELLQSMELSKDQKSIVFKYLKETRSKKPGEIADYSQETFTWRP